MVKFAVVLHPVSTMRPTSVSRRSRRDIVRSLGRYSRLSRCWPNRPRITEKTPAPDRVQILLQAYNAAVHFHTGTLNPVPSRITAKLRSMLTRTANRFSRWPMAPHTFAVAAMSWLLEKSPGKIPPIHQLFNPGFARKLSHMVAELLQSPAADAWRGAPFQTHSMRLVGEFWSEAYDILRRKIDQPGVTQRAVDEACSTLFGSVYSKLLREATREYRTRIKSDHVAMDRGEWVWV